MMVVKNQNHNIYWKHKLFCENMLWEQNLGSKQPEEKQKEMKEVNYKRVEIGYVLIGREKS